MPELSFRVNAVTAGGPSHRFEHLSGGYEWRGTPGWTGGNIPEVREDAFLAGGEASGAPAARAAQKRERFAAYTAARDDGLDQVQAAERTGIGRRTMNRYERDYQAAKAARS